MAYYEGCIACEGAWDVVPGRLDNKDEEEDGEVADRKESHSCSTAVGAVMGASNGGTYWD